MFLTHKLAGFVAAMLVGVIMTILVAMAKSGAPVTFFPLLLAVSIAAMTAFAVYVATPADAADAALRRVDARAFKAGLSVDQQCELISNFYAAKAAWARQWEIDNSPRLQARR